MTKYVKITEKRHKELLEAEDWLEWLEAAGIDNCNAYGEAHEMREEAEREEREEETS